MSSDYDVIVPGGGSFSVEVVCPAQGAHRPPRTCARGIG